MLNTITQFLNETSIVKLRKILWTAVAVMLAVPLVAMQFTNEVNWGLGDFVAFAALLTFAILGFEISLKFLKNKKHVTYAGFAIAAAFLFVWAELAVGVVS